MKFCLFHTVYIVPVLDTLNTAATRRIHQFNYAAYRIYMQYNATITTIVKRDYSIILNFLNETSIVKYRLFELRPTDE